ncbi:hypothetical protein D3C74_114210 [compost metagenome]
MNLLHVDRNTYLSRILEKSSFHNVIVLPYCIQIIQQICCMKISSTMEAWTGSNIGLDQIYENGGMSEMNHNWRPSCEVELMDVIRHNSIHAFQVGQPEAVVVSSLGSLSSPLQK